MSFCKALIDIEKALKDAVGKNGHFLCERKIFFVNESHIIAAKKGIMPANGSAKPFVGINFAIENVDLTLMKNWGAINMEKLS